MNKQKIFTFLLLLWSSAIFAQFEIELNKIYDGEIYINGNTYNELIIHTNFKDSLIISELENNFGKYSRIQSVKGKVFLFEKIKNEKWKFNSVNLYVTFGKIIKTLKDTKGNDVKSKHGEKIVKRQKFITFYALNSADEDQLKNLKFKRKLKKIIKKVLKKIKTK